MKKIHDPKGMVAAFLIAGWLWVIVGFGSDQSASIAKAKEDDEQSAWEKKHCDPRDFVKDEWHDGVPFYDAARRCITKDELPQLYRMLQDKDWAAYWHLIARTIAYVSFDQDSVEGDPESTAALLDYVRRDDVWYFTHDSQVEGKAYAVEYIGMTSGRDANSVLREAVTRQGALALANNWINQQWQLPDKNSPWNDKEFVVQIIQGLACKGLIWTAEPENIELVEKLWAEQKAYKQDHPDSEIRSMYYYLCDAVSIRDAVADVGYETYFNADANRMLELVEPYLRKYLEPQDQPSEDADPNAEQPALEKKYGDPRDFVRDEGGVGYEDARRFIKKDKLPLLYEMLQDANYAPYWHNVARAIACVGEDDPNAAPALLHYFQRDDSWNFKELERLTVKAAVPYWLGVVAGPEADSFLRKATTEDGAKELAKDWINQKWQVQPLSSSWNTPEKVIEFVRASAVQGLILTGKPENIEFVEQLYTAQNDYCRERRIHGVWLGYLIDAMVMRDAIAELGRGGYLSLSPRKRFQAKEKYDERYGWEQEQEQEPASGPDVPEDVEARARKLFGENVIRVKRRDVLALVSRLGEAYEFYNVTISRPRRSGFGPEKTYPMAFGKKAFKLSKPKEIAAFLTGLDKAVGSEWEVLERVFVFAELLDRQVRTHMPKRKSRIKRFAEQKPEDWHLVMSGTDASWRVALTLLLNPRSESCMRYELDISKAGEISIVSERFVYQYARLS